MQLRFLQITDSGRLGFPFQAGQIIHVEKLTPEMKRWLRDGFAEVVREAPKAEAAMLDGPRARGSR